MSSSLSLSAEWQGYTDFMKSRGTLESVMIIGAEDGAHYASSPSSFVLREYKGTVTNEEGEEKEETINEAKSIVQLVKNADPKNINSKVPVPHGLRLNSSKKQMMIRTFQDEESKLPVIYGKFPKGGSCVASAGPVIVIGTFDENKDHNSVQANDTVQLICRYLAASTWPDRGGAPVPPGVKVEKSTKAELMDLRATWQPFADQMLIGKGNVSACCLYSLQSGQLYACSDLARKEAGPGGSGNDKPKRASVSAPDFLLKSYETEVAQEDGTDKMTAVDEFKACKSMVEAPAGTRPAGGIRVNEVKFQFLRGAVDEVSQTHMIQGKKGKQGVVLTCSKSVLIVCVYDELKGHLAASCAGTVADLAKYFVSKGF